MDHWRSGDARICSGPGLVGEGPMYNSLCLSAALWSSSLSGGAQLTFDGRVSVFGLSVSAVHAWRPAPPSIGDQLMTQLTQLAAQPGASGVVVNQAPQ